MAIVKFSKGLVANLPATYNEGTFYVATDERALYLDVSGSERIRIGDFQEFATLSALQANTNPSTTALYYVAELNVLAKWNGTQYVQINLDTGATSVEVTGTGNAVTSASYDPATRKITLTKGETFATPAVVDEKIAAKVGDVGEVTVKSYVDEQVANVVAGSIDGLGALASKDTVAETDLDTALAAKLNGKADVGTDADASTVDSVKGAKKYADEKASAAQTAAQGYTDTAIAGLDAPDAEVANQVVTAVSEADGIITVTRRALVAADIPTLAISKVDGLQTALDGKADDGDVSAVAGRVTTLEGTDAGKSVRTIANEELAAQLIPATASESLDTLKEIADWIQAHPDDASAMNTAIEALEAKVDTGDQTVSAYVAAAIAALNIGDYATAANLTALAERVTTLEGTSHTHANKALLDTYTQTEANLADAVAKKHSHANATVLDGIAAEKVTAWDAAEQNAKDYADGLAGNYDAKGSATTAETNAKSYADSLASNYDAAGSADAAETAAKSYTDTALTWGSF